MGKPRALQRSKSFPPCGNAYNCHYNIGKAVAGGCRSTWESLLEIIPSLGEEYKADINGLVKTVEALEAEVMDLMNRWKDLKKECACSKAEAKDLKKKFDDVAHQLAVIKRKTMLRDVLSNFKSSCHPTNQEMMEAVHRKLPGVFHKRYTTFTAMVSDLVRRQMSGENQEIHGVEQRLCDLLKEATDFRTENLAWWNSETGKQLFYLCRSVAQWNVDTFHQDLKGNLSRPLMMNGIRKGLFKVDDKGVFSDTGVDLGPVLMELLFAKKDSFEVNR